MADVRNDLQAILDDKHNILSGANEAGEVVLRGPTVMDGYLDDEAASAEISQFGWHHTGDIGQFDEDGYFYITDRKRDLIISGGFNIFPFEVESALMKHPAVQDCAVIGVPDEKWGELVLGLVVTTPGSTLDEATLIAYVKTKLAGYKCPKRIEFRTELARTATGKLQKFKLREPYWAGRTRGVN